MDMIMWHTKNESHKLLCQNIENAFYILFIINVVSMHFIQLI